MRFSTSQHTCYGSIALHVDWRYLCVLDADGEEHVHKNIRTTPTAFLQALQPCREDVVVCVECLFTWDWLADLCEGAGIPFVWGHALYRRAMHGGQAKHDRIDSHEIAALLRGGLIAQASVYPRRMRATRDLFRRRNHFLRKRAEVSAHIQNTARQSHLSAPLGRIATPQTRQGLLARFDHRCVQKNMAVDVALADLYDPLLAEWERYLEKIAHGHAPVSLALLLTLPGVGDILALVMLSEIEQITRSPRVQACVPYCRVVKRAQDAHGTRYGTSGKKIGNAHRKWAFSEAAGLFLRHNAPAPKSPAKLATRHGQGKARSLLAHKRGRAVYCMLMQRVAFDQAKVLAT